MHTCAADQGVDNVSLLDVLNSARISMQCIPRAGGCKAYQEGGVNQSPQEGTCTQTLGAGGGGGHASDAVLDPQPLSPAPALVL